MVKATLVQLPTGLSLVPEIVTSTGKPTISRPSGASLQTGAGNSTYMPFVGGAMTTGPSSLRGIYLLLLLQVLRLVFSEQSIEFLVKF
jgi:hypothetical protein